MIVQDILKSKGRQIYSIEPQKSVYEAIKVLDKYDIGALLVMEDNRLQGMLSERDYRSKVILKGRTSKKTKVSQIMTAGVFIVSPKQSVEECMSIMTEKKIRHLPVLKQDEVVGVVSIGDLVKAIISKQKVEINNLREYIEGGYPA